MNLKLVNWCRSWRTDPAMNFGGCGTTIWMNFSSMLCQTLINLSNLMMPSLGICATMVSKCSMFNTCFSQHSSTVNKPDYHSSTASWHTPSSVLTPTKHSLSLLSASGSPSGHRRNWPMMPFMVWPVLKMNSAHQRRHIHSSTTVNSSTSSSSRRYPIYSTLEMHSRWSRRRSLSGRWPRQLDRMNHWSFVWSSNTILSCPLRVWRLSNGRTMSTSTTWQQSKAGMLPISEMVIWWLVAASEQTEWPSKPWHALVSSIGWSWWCCLLNVTTCILTLFSVVLANEPSPSTVVWADTMHVFTVQVHDDNNNLLSKPEWILHGQNVCDALRTLLDDPQLMFYDASDEEISIIEQREARHNVLALDDGHVVTYGGGNAEKGVVAGLRENGGFRVGGFPTEGLLEGAGGAHCMSNALRRHSASH